MTNRRTFLGGVLAASAWDGSASPARPMCDRPGRRRSISMPRARSRIGAVLGPVLGNLAGQLGTPESVELRSVQVGHFHGLMHEGDGRVAYLYEATIPGPCPRRGLVKLGDAAAWPSPDRSS